MGRPFVLFLSLFAANVIDTRTGTHRVSSRVPFTKRLTLDKTTDFELRSTRLGDRATRYDSRILSTNDRMVFVYRYGLDLDFRNQPAGIPPRRSRDCHEDRSNSGLAVRRKTPRRDLDFASRCALLLFYRLPRYSPVPRDGPSHCFSRVIFRWNESFCNERR